MGDRGGAGQQVQLISVCGSGGPDQVRVDALCVRQHVRDSVTRGDTQATCRTAEATVQINEKRWPLAHAVQFPGEIHREHGGAASASSGQDGDDRVSVGHPAPCRGRCQLSENTGKIGGDCALEKEMPRPRLHGLDHRFRRLVACRDDESHVWQSCHKRLHISQLLRGTIVDIDDNRRHFILLKGNREIVQTGEVLRRGEDRRRLDHLGDVALDLSVLGDGEQSCRFGHDLDPVTCPRGGGLLELGPVSGGADDPGLLMSDPRPGAFEPVESQLPGSFCVRGR